LPYHIIIIFHFLPIFTYSEQERKQGYLKKNFIQAKYDFIDQMMDFGGVGKGADLKKPLRVLDVGCGIGGTTR